MSTSVLSAEELGCQDVRWDLSDLFAGIDDPKINQTLADSEVDIKAFVERYKGKLGDLDAAGLRKAYEEKDALITPLYQVSQFSHLSLSLDTQNEAVKALVARVDETLSRLSNELVFFSLELGQLDEAIYTKQNDPEILKDYAYAYRYTRQKAKHRLSEKEEQLVNLKDLTGIRAARNLYGELTSAFEFEFELDGDLKTLNGSQLRNLRLHKDQDVRRRAMDLFFSRYEDNKITFTHLYNTIVKDYNIERKLRGYSTPIGVMNSGNDLDDKAVDVLHEVTRESYPLVHRYYRLKAKLCQLPTMTLSDIYAPLPEVDKSYKWDEAKAMVLDSFQAFDPVFADHSKTLFEGGYVDAPVGGSKRGGAFCSSSTPDKLPYVLLNFQGKPRDISTIAHEFGHAIHAILSQGQVNTNYHAILPLCETASVFAEMVLMDYMKKTETDRSARIALLADKLEDLFATSHRQNMFSDFEMAAHDRITEGLMSADDLGDLYQEQLSKMFGDSVSITPNYRWEWSTIPHIFDVPFYVHSYNFGNLLVLALYGQYLEEGQSFIPRLKTFLSKGSSASPKELTEALGVSITDPDFWRKSLVYIESLIDELEGLVEGSD